MSAGWHAELELQFEHNREVTRLMRRRHVGPLAVQQPFYPEKTAARMSIFFIHRAVLLVKMFLIFLAFGARRQGSPDDAGCHQILSQRAGP